MHKNRKNKIPKKGGLMSVVFLGIFSVLAMLCVVVFVAGDFLAYSFNELYIRSADSADNLSKSLAMHISDKQARAYDCGRLITEYIERESLERTEENLTTLNYILRTATGKQNNSISACVFFDDDNGAIENYNYYQNAKGGIFGTSSCENADGMLFIVYTAPIMHEGITIGFVCISESGAIESVYHNFAGNQQTGVIMSYIMTNNNNPLAYIGNALPNYTYKETSLIDTSLTNLNYEIYIESINETILPIAKHFVLPGKVALGKLSNTATPTSLHEIINGKGSILLANLWFKAPVQKLPFYIWTQVKIYLEPKMLLSLLAITGFVLLLMAIPFALMLATITTRIRSQRSLEKAVQTDEITGYGNWLFFKDRTAYLLKRAKGTKYALVSLELNKYRLMADYYGMEFAQTSLDAISEALSRITGKMEAFARYEESQFSLLLAYESEPELLRRTNGILNTLAQLFSDGKITFRAGIYPILEKLVDISAINMCAINAKDLITESASNKAIMFDTAQRERNLRVKRFEDLMEPALANQEFIVYLQPKYRPDTNELAGAEALIRWQSAELGFISPGEFIPVFEKNGFIAKIDDYMLAKVAQIQSRWRYEGRDCVPISVNISRVHFTNPKLATHISDIVDAYTVPHNLIELELTESAFFDDQSLLLGTVSNLREQGFLVSMDDFGSGYSSLNSLKDIPLDIIKLDMGFFEKTGTSQRGETVIKGTIELAKQLNMKTVAEGIETREQVEFLQSLGCDYIQGYYYAKPMPVQEFEMLNEKSEARV